MRDDSRRRWRGGVAAGHSTVKEAPAVFDATRRAFVPLRPGIWRLRRMAQDEDARVGEPLGHGPLRRSLLLGGGIATGMALTAAASGQTRPTQAETDTDPCILNGQPVPEPPPNRSAGPVRAGRGSALTGKV